MKLLLFIDNLGSGGAQRQLVLLAVLLKAHGHEVIFVTYNAGEHFAPGLEAAGIRRARLDGWPKWMRPVALRSILNKFHPDAVIAFQEAASLYAELASSVMKKWRLVVSERSAIPFSEINPIFHCLKIFHRLADVITTNSHANRFQLERAFPFLRSRLTTIYNAVDTVKFRPEKRPQCRNELKFVVLGSHKPSKNFEGLAAAVKVLAEHKNIPKFLIDWYGDEAPGWLAKDMACCKSLGVCSVIQCHPATSTPERVLADADALILPSLWEGLPNVVCEALSTGCPVMMSDVADAGFLVKDGVTGYLFNPGSRDSIVNAIRRFLLLSNEQRQNMRIEARRFAERVFDPIRYVTAYERILEGVKYIKP